MTLSVTWKGIWRGRQIWTVSSSPSDHIVWHSGGPFDQQRRTSVHSRKITKALGNFGALNFWITKNRATRTRRKRRRRRRRRRKLRRRTIIVHQGRRRRAIIVHQGQTPWLWSRYSPYRYLQSHRRGLDRDIHR